MGMSMHVVGFMPPTEEYKRKVEAYRACKAAGIQVPRELDVFFGYDVPDDAGMKVDMSRLETVMAVTDWTDDTRQGYELDVAKLPAGVTKVRFYCSW